MVLRVARYRSPDVAQTWSAVPVGVARTRASILTRASVPAARRKPQQPAAGPAFAIAGFGNCDFANYPAAAYLFV